MSHEYIQLFNLFTFAPLFDLPHPSAALLLLHQRHRRQIRKFVQASTASAHGRVKFKTLSAFSLCFLLSPCTACRSANGKVVSMPKLLFCWNWLHFEQEK